jgi:cobalt/nickel transport system permease protein
MKHHFLDQYSEGHSIIHRLDPRAKFIGVLVFVLGVVLTPVAYWLSFACFLVLLLILISLSRVSLIYLLKRSLVALPFMIMVGIFIPFFKSGEVVYAIQFWNWHISLTLTGLELMGTLLAKAWLSVLVMAILMAMTRMTDLLKGLEKLKCPLLLIMLLNFMYRYLFVLSDEAMRLKQARDSRHFGGGILLNIKTVGNMAGSLFVRSYERGERIYAAMLSRGFEGQSRSINLLKFRVADTFFCIIWIAIVITISVMSHTDLV